MLLHLKEQWDAISEAVDIETILDIFTADGNPCFNDERMPFKGRRLFTGSRHKLKNRKRGKGKVCRCSVFQGKSSRERMIKTCCTCGSSSLRIPSRKLYSPAGLRHEPSGAFTFTSFKSWTSREIDFTSILLGFILSSKPSPSSAKIR